LYEGTDLEGKVGAVEMEGCGVAADDSLRCGDASGGEQEGEGADCGHSYALRAVSQARSPRVGWQKKAAGERRPLGFSYRF
jgi:hypothetical protein